MARVEKTSLQFEITINGEKKVLQTMKEVRAQRRTLLKQLESLTKGSDQYNKKIQELGKLNSIVNDHKNKIKQAGTSLNLAGKAGAGFNKVVGKIGAGLKAAFGPIGLILAAGAALINMGKAAFDSAEEIRGVQERVNQLSGLIGDELNESSATVVALSKTFGTDVAQNIEAANAAANAFKKDGEELGPVFNESLDKIGDRLLGLGDKGGEFLSQITEYSSQAEEAGLSMDRFFNVVTTGINRGVPTDKLIDSIKEADNIIKNISKGQKDTLEDTLGKGFVDELLDGVETGKLQTIDVLDEISGAINQVGVGSADAKKIVSSLFGGPGEDATSRYIALLDGVGGSLSDVVDESNIYIQRKKELFELEKQAGEAAAELAFLTDGAGDTFAKVGLKIKTFFISSLSTIIEFIQYFPDYFMAATSSGKAFVNTLIGAFESFLRIGLYPIIAVLEKLTGTSFKLPRLDIEENPFGKVEEKIAADRKGFEERQRQSTLSGQGKTEEAQRLQALQAQKKRSDELSKERAAERDRQLKDEQAAQKAIEDLRTSLIADQVQRQIEQLKLAADRQIAAAKGSAELIAEQEKLIREKLVADIAKVEKAAEDKAAAEKDKRIKDQQKKESQALKDQLASLEADLERKTLEITEKLVSSVEDGTVSAVEAEKSLQDQLKDEYLKFLEEKKKILLASGESTTALELEQEQAKFDKLLELAEEDKARRGGLSGEELGDLAEQTAFDFAEGLANKALDNEIGRIEKRREALEDAEAEAIARAGNNEKAQIAIKKKFGAQKEALDKEQARKEKSLALKRSLIDFALALFKAIASAPPPINLGAIALQTALLTIPQGILSAINFAKGGLLPEAGKGGRAVGPSHQEGHIALVHGRSGKTLGAIEGGEPILSNQTYANNKDLVDELLYSSMYQGGKAIVRPMYGLSKEAQLYNPGKSLFNTGGILPITNTTPTNQTTSTAKANPEFSILSDQLGDLSQAYRDGKTIIMSEKEADLIGELLDKRSADRLRRA